MNFKEALIAHPYAQVLRWIADGERIEFYYSVNGWSSESHSDALRKISNGDLRHDLFRLAPRTITVNGVEVPAPESVAPSDGDTYFTPDLGNRDLAGFMTWQCDEYDDRLFARGLVYLNKEDAIARAKAMLITKEN